MPRQRAVAEKTEKTRHLNGWLQEERERLGGSRAGKRTPEVLHGQVQIPSRYPRKILTNCLTRRRRVVDDIHVSRLDEIHVRRLRPEVDRTRRVVARALLARL